MAAKKNLLEAMGQIEKPEKLQATPQKLGDAENIKPRKDSNTRDGKKSVVGYFDPLVNKQLRLMALNADTTVQALLGEAIDDFFEKNGKSRIALT